MRQIRPKHFVFSDITFQNTSVQPKTISVNNNLAGYSVLIPHVSHDVQDVNMLDELLRLKRCKFASKKQGCSHWGILGLSHSGFHSCLPQSEDLMSIRLTGNSE